MRQMTKMSQRKKKPRPGRRITGGHERSPKRPSNFASTFSEKVPTMPQTERASIHAPKGDNRGGRQTTTLTDIQEPGQCETDIGDDQEDYKRFSIVSFSSVASTAYFSAEDGEDDSTFSDSTLGGCTSSEDEYLLTEDGLISRSEFNASNIMNSKLRSVMQTMVQLHFWSRSRTKNPTPTPSAVKNPTPPKNLGLIATPTPQPWEGMYYPPRQKSKQRREGVSDDSDDTQFIPRPPTPLPPFDEDDDDDDGSTSAFRITAFDNLLSEPAPPTMFVKNNSHVKSDSDRATITVEPSDAETQPNRDYVEGSSGKEVNNSWRSAHSQQTITRIQEAANDRKTVVAPSFDEIMEDVRTRVGCDVTFKVKVVGCPSPDVIWLKDSNEVSAPNVTRSFNKEMHCLVIKNVAPGQSGVYSCVAKSGVGEVVCKAELTVLPESDQSFSSDNEHAATNSQKFCDDYVTGAVIAKGSFSTIRSVVRKIDGKNFAGKFVRKKGDARKQTENEVHFLRRIQHQNVVAFYGYYSHEKKYKTIVLEPCGQELFDFFLTLDEVTEIMVAGYMKELCGALSHIHSLNIVHLDIKPENLMLSKESHSLKLIDFGFAKDLGQKRPCYSDQGIPDFVAPEIINDEPVTPLSDMWSVGVITYLALSGISPFCGENDQATLYNIRECDWSFAHKEFADVTEQAKLFVTSLLTSAPNDRLSADRALSRAWIVSPSKQRLAIERLKYFQSRRKWQRSLVTEKSTLVSRSITSLLRGDFDSTSLNVPRNVIGLSREFSDSESDVGSSSEKEETRKAGTAVMTEPKWTNNRNQPSCTQPSKPILSTAMRKRALFEKSRSYSGSMDRPLQIVTEPTDVVADLPTIVRSGSGGWRGGKLSSVGKKVSFEDEVHSAATTPEKEGFPLKSIQTSHPVNAPSSRTDSLSLTFCYQQDDANVNHSETASEKEKRLNDGALAAMNCRAVVVDEDVSPTTTCCVHRDIWARGSSRGQPLRGDVAGSLSTAKKPTKGILKKSRSVDSPAKVLFFEDGCLETGHHYTKTFSKSVSPDADSSPGIRKLSKAAKRRLQFRRGQSAESALQQLRPRCGGLRGPLLERRIDEDSENLTAGARMRTSPAIKKVLSVDKLPFISTGNSNIHHTALQKSPPGSPSRPEIMRGQDGEAWIAWKPPAGSQDSDLLRYFVEYQDSVKKTWTPCDVAIYDTVYHVTQLNPFLTYVFRVAAKNKVGTGPYSDVSAPICFS